MKKGFTLVELLAVFVIIGVIAVIIVPNTIDLLKSQNQKVYELKESQLVESAKKYVEFDEGFDKPNINESTYIPIMNLITGNYIEKIIDSKTKEFCSGFVKVTNNNGDDNYNYEPCILCDEYKTDANYCSTEKLEESKEYLTATAFVTSLYNDEELKDINGVITDNTDDKNIRYSGSEENVKNYAYFNCSAKDSTNIDYGKEHYNYSTSCELWRIIGVLDAKHNGTTSRKVKLVRNSPLELTPSIKDASWDSSSSLINNGTGINEWSESDIEKILNEYYLGYSSSCLYCNGSNQLSCNNSCTFNTLSFLSKNMIDNVVWNLSGITKSNMSASEQYASERGNNLVKVGYTCSGIFCNDTVNRNLTWNGKVGLIYASDYAYASSNSICRQNIRVTIDTPCISNNWLHSEKSYWTISPFFYSGIADNNSNGANGVYYVYSGGYLTYNNAYQGHSIRPSVYLKDYIKIIGGSGTFNDPYKFN